MRLSPLLRQRRDAMSKCSIEGCNKEARTRGWCHMHYKRWQTYGDPQKVRMHVVRHGLHGLKEYQIWQGMIGRCHSPRNTGYPTYGARGIVVCLGLRRSFQLFYEILGKRPDRRYSVDR